MPRIKDLQNYTGTLNRSDIYFAVDGNSFSRGMSMSGQQVHTLCKGIDGKNIELRSNSTHIQWRWEGDSTWANLIAVSSLKGEDGKELEIRVNSGYIQTRLTGGTWSNLIDLESLKGPKGDDAALPNFTFQVNALAADAMPTSEITGTYPNLAVTLGLPRGHDAALPNFTFQVNALAADATPASSITGTYPNLLVTLGIPKGHDAALPVFTFEAEKVTPGSNPDVSVTGSYPDLNLKFKIPEGLRGEQGKPLVVLANGNYGNWDEQSADYVDSGVTASATVDIENVPVNFTEATVCENIHTGETVPVIFGKLKKWWNNLGSLAWKSKVDYATEVDNLPTLISLSDVNDTISSHNADTDAHSNVFSEFKSLAKKDKVDYLNDIINLPVIPDSQVQSDWNQTDSSQRNFINNKPALPAKISDLENDLGFATIVQSDNKYQPKEAGKGLSAEDFTTQYKNLLAFYLTTATATSLANLSLSCQTIYANINSNQTLSVSGQPPAGQPIHVYVKNVGSSNFTIAIPSSGNYINMSAASVTIAAGSYIEIDIIYDLNESKYKIVVLEKA